MAGAAIRPAQPGIGGGGGTVSGSITGAYSFNGPFSVVNATNVYLNAGISNLVGAGVNEYATNYLSLLRAYTNIIHVGYSNDALSSGLNLTNISTKAPAGSLVIVGPGAYNIPTNTVSLAGRGVDMYFHPGAVVSVGRSSDLTTTTAIFDDALAGTGASTNRIMGFGEFHASNALGGIVIVQEGDSDFYIECKSAWVHGPTSAILQTAGSLDFTAHEFVRADDYDVYEGGSTAPRKIVFRASRAYAGDSIVETAAAFTNWGDGVFTIGYGEALSGGGSFGNVALAISDKSIMDIGVLNFKRSAACISGALTNKAMSGSGILLNCTVYSLPASTYSTIGRYDATYGTEFRLVNCTIYGPTGVDPIHYSTAAGKFSLENTRVISGANATNSIRAGVTGSRIEMAGLSSLDKPRHANVTLVNSTNYTTTISATKAYLTELNVSGDTVISDLYVPGANWADSLFLTNSLFIPYLNSSAVPDGTGSIVQRSNAWATGRGTILFNDQTADVALVGTLLSDTPSNGQVPTFNTGGTITWETPGAASAVSNFVVSAHGNLTVTNTLTVGTGSTAASMIGINSFQGDAFALTRATNSPAATGSTNDLQISRSSATAGQVLTLHSTSAGQHVWTNATAAAGGSVTNNGLTNATVIGQVAGTSAIKTVTAGTGVTIEDRGTNLLFSSTARAILTFETQVSASAANATTYYLGSAAGTTLRTTFSDVSQIMPYDCTVTRVVIHWFVSNTPSTESLTFNLTDGTNDSSTWTKGISPSRDSFDSGAISYAVTAGEEIAVEILTPTWVTPPTALHMTADIYVTF